MELIPAFDPTSATSGSFIASTLQTGSQMIITNKSYVNLIFTFASGDQRPVLANDRRAFTFGGASSVPGPSIKWEQQSIDYPQTINQLENLVYVEIYAPTEVITEKYPAVIQRETLPSLIPYNIGYGTYQLYYQSVQQATATSGVIWPSSYYGITCAPTAVGGMGFDHFWSYQNLTQTTMEDVPGSYGSTGKTSNPATPINRNLLSYVPGPFSRLGLTPVDSATYLNSTYWQLANLITWPANFYIDAWFMLPNIGGRQYFILSDDVVTLGINASGTVFAQLNYSGGSVFATTSTSITTNQWYHVALYVVGTNVLLWLNGTQVASTTATGTINTPANHVKIGASNAASNTFIGSITNIGFLLSDIASTAWGVQSIEARYLLGLQSLNVDMQYAWLKSIFLEVTNVSANATLAPGEITLGPMFNPSGLLYSRVHAATNPPNVYAGFPGSVFLTFPTLQGGAVFQQYIPFDNPLSHYPLTFPSFTMSFNANPTIFPSLSMQVNGYNFLGIR